MQLQVRIGSPGGVPERLNGAVSKTVVGGDFHPGFESLLLRHLEITLFSIPVVSQIWFSASASLLFLLKSKYHTGRLYSFGIIRKL